jgi:hypothetical protein
MIQPRLYPCSMAFRCSKGHVVGRCRPDSVLGDRAYDAERIRRALRSRQILPGSQGAIRSMVAGWDDGAGLWNVPSHG